MSISELSSGRSFGSDNYAGMHPAVVEALVAANIGHDRPYGDDATTARLGDVMRRHFGEQALAFPVFNGTGANVVALSSLVRRWEAVICSDAAHIHTDEGGAPEIVGGFKLHALPTTDGKLTPELVESACIAFGFVHRAQQGAVSITQGTEFGTLYTVEEIRAVVETAHRHGLPVHLDGARIANACAALGVTLREMVTETGVDIVSLGGTKNGAMLAEAVVVVNPERVQGVEYLRKTLTQLTSKMRFISAQLLALFEGDVWLDNARHSNAMAQRLAAALRDVDGARLSQTPEANGVFVVLPDAVARRLMERVPFYFWNEPIGEVRLMCSFDTSEADVDEFVAMVREELERG